MALATFKDLCIDAADPVVLGTFWGAALGLTVEPVERDEVALRGPTPAHTVWINRVPEPKTVKHRVHLDIHAVSTDELVGLGAMVLDAQSFQWTVMADPEGGEFCAFEREQPPPAYRLYELGIDCIDHEAQSTWWHTVLGGERHVDGSEWSHLDRVPGLPFGAIDFAEVPEAKQAKNRLHIDLTAPDIAPIIAHGATLLRARDDEIRWDVLADPEGNEFCVFAADS